jgi:hypothetical protein
MIPKPVVKREEAEIASRHVSAIEEGERRLHRGHLEALRQPIELPIEIGGQHTFQSRVRRLRQFAHVVIRQHVQGGIGPLR